MRVLPRPEPDERPESGAQGHSGVHEGKVQARGRALHRFLGPADALIDEFLAFAVAPGIPRLMGVADLVSAQLLVEPLRPAPALTGLDHGPRTSAGTQFRV